MKLIERPIREVRRILEKLGCEAPFTRVWARAFNANGKRVPPVESDVFSFQITAQLQPAWIVRSLGVYTTSREQNGRPREGYRIVWSPRTKGELLTAARDLPTHGLVHNKTGRGVRVKAPDKVYSVVNPGKTIPTVQAFAAPGIKAEALTACAAKLPWEIRVKKFIGSADAIVASIQEPAKQVLMLNGQPVLALSMPTGEPAAKPIVAGSIAIQSQGSKAEKDILQEADPWARAKLPSIAHPRISP